MAKKMLAVALCVLVLACLLAWFSQAHVPVATSPGATSGINAADVAWVSISAGLVMLMTPALGFFYGGLVRRKNLVSTVVQCFIIFAVACVVWTVWGYSLAFAPTHEGVIGGLKYLLLRGVGAAPNVAYAPTIPALSHYFFQMKFAAITPALIVGAIAERIRFRSLLVFIVVWATIVYAPVAHWVWGAGGWLGPQHLGVLDFAGGIVVHLLAGVSALAAALVVGRRTPTPDEVEGPSNVPYVILGAALLWFGWFGFNAGSALAMNAIAVNALVVTNISAAVACLSWMTVDWVLIGKPTATGAAVGAICGLGAITPASGFVGLTDAMIIGLLAGMMCNFVVVALRKTRLDDTLDVFACHGIGGLWGSLATGLFAQKLINPAGSNGLFYGNPHQFVIQAIAVVACAAWGFFMTIAILKVVEKLMGLRVTPEEEALGLDVSQHGEVAYAELTWYVPSVLDGAQPVGEPEFHYTYEKKRPK